MAFIIFHENFFRFGWIKKYDCELFLKDLEWIWEKLPLVIKWLITETDAYFVNTTNVFKKHVCLSVELEPERKPRTSVEIVAYVYDYACSAY